MATLSEARLRQIIDRFDEVEARMGVASDSKEILWGRAAPRRM